MKILPTLVLSLFLALPALSAPVILIDTLPGNQNVGASIGTPPVIGSSTGAANSFSTGLAPLSLTSVEAAIGFFPNFGDAAGSNLSLALFSDAAGNPGSLLVALLPSQPLDPLPFSTGSSFLPAAPTLLAANTTFWVVALATDNNTLYAWNFVQGQGLGRQSIDGGASWSINTAGAMRVTADDELPTGVPEIQPASAAWPVLFCLALTAVLSSRRSLKATAPGPSNP